MSNSTINKPFKLGQVVQTATSRAILNPISVLICLQRHSRGDWGDVCPEDAKSNDLALKNGGRILSSYKDEEGEKFWIITEHDRSATTILLPSDY